MPTASRRLKHSARVTLMRAGRLLGTEPQRFVRSLHSYLELGAWTRSIGSPLPEHKHTREELFELALSRVSGTRPLYLEFGVYQGESFRWWMQHQTKADARFVGFDSFEGLPETWNPRHGKGHFAVPGAPELLDDRGEFVVGWFDQTLPSFTLPEHDQLVVSIDCDLYSSALFVLRQLAPQLVPGTLLYFDEFNDRDHELRALQELLGETELRVKPLAHSQGGVNWLFQVV